MQILIRTSVGNEGFNAAHQVPDTIGLNADSNASFYTDYVSNHCYSSP